MTQVTDPTILEQLNGGGSSFPGVIEGRTRPVDPMDVRSDAREQIRTDIAVDSAQRDARSDALSAELAALNIEEKRRELQQAEEKAAKLEGAQGIASGELSRVIDKIDQIYGDALGSGWFETGLTGSMVKGIPGTAAYDLRSDLQTVDANSAFAALQAMRDASPTGGALGQVTERELDLLKSKIANLNPDQSQDQFLRNLGEAKGAYIEMLRRVDPAKAEAYENVEGATRDEQGNITFDERQREAVAATSPTGSGGGGYLTALAQGTGSIVEGFGDFLGIAVNPVGQMVYDAAGYDQRYDTGQILREATGLPANPNELNDAIIGGATAALTGAGAARGALSLATGPVARNALASVGRTPVRDAAAGAGAGAGAQMAQEYGPVAQTAAGLAGGLVGYGGANALARGISDTAPNALAQAAGRQGVDLLPADAGGPVAKAMTTGTKASPLSVSPVVKAAQRQQEQTASAAGRAARQSGEVLDPEDAGAMVREGARRFTKETSQRASRLYDRAGEMAKGVKIKPLQTLKKLDDYIARVQNDPAAPESAVSELARFRDRISGGVNVSGLRDARSRLSQGVYDGQLRSGADKAMWKDVLSDLSSDIDLGLRQAGREDAANLFNRADEFWKGRVEQIDEVLQPILGKDRSGEQVLEAVERLASAKGGNNRRLSRLLGNLAPEEAGNVRATIADRIGRATPGQQTADGNAFSPATFLTNWNRMSPRAKSTLFGNTQQRKDLNDIAKLTEGMKQSQAMANFSNTGIAIGSNVAGGTALALAHPALAASGAAAQFITGKLMASPRFARTLARTIKMPPKSANRALKEQLAIIGTREPALRADSQTLLNALNDNAMVANVAAEGDNKQN